MSTCIAGHLDTACPLSPFYASSTRWWIEGRQIVQTAPSCWRIKAADLTFHHYVGHMCFPPHPSCHTHHATPTILTISHHVTVPYPPCHTMSPYHTHHAMPMSQPVTTPCTTIHTTPTHHIHTPHTHTPHTTGSANSCSTCTLSTPPSGSRRCFGWPGLSSG